MALLKVLGSRMAKKGLALAMSGSTSAPYWGQLPPPKARRLSEDGSLTPDRRQSLDVHPQSKPNRESIQTTNTDTLTDTTFSSLASPNRSSFQGQGLAPRPPSLPYGANQYPPELLENRRRRRSKNQDDEEYSRGAPPPAAPDVPRAPPVSYKAPNGTGAVQYTHPAPGPAGRTSRRPDGPVSPMDQSPRRATFADRQKDLPVLDRARNTLDPGSDARARRNGTDPTAARSALTSDMAGTQRQRRGSVGDAAGPQRRSSQGQPSSRRPYANERSPLQRLELTLDSITKEEKRALAEAAERAAREKAASNSRPAAQADRGPPVPQKDQPVQQVRFSDRGPPLAVEVPKTRNTGGRSSENTPATPKGPLSQHPPEEGRRYSASAGKSPQAQTPESRIPVPVAPQTRSQALSQASGVPQRNLSFRERAAKNDVKLPAGLENEIPTSPLVATPGSTGTISRSGSNKLRKNPPASYAPNAGADPYAKKQMDAQKYIMAQQAHSSPRSNEARVRTAGPAAPLPAGAPIRPGAADETEPVTPSAGKQALHGQEVMPSAAVGELSKAQQSQRKADQLLGRTPSQNVPAQRAKTGHGIGPQAAALTAGAAGAAVAAGSQHHRAKREDTRSDTDSSDDEHHHRVSNIVYGHGREKLRPGQGMYQPPTFLDEWKKATVGTLSGALLDLEDEPANVTIEKDKPWWETPPSQRRGSVASRPRKAEAFDGEYDDTHAPTRFKPPLYLKCGPLLRYCGIRTERGPSRTTRSGVIYEREVWRGSVMIVTQDADSSYDIAPTLRLFVQPIELLPPPPAEIHGELPPEHVDPIAGHPKLGRKGETLYVRPVDHLEEAKDLSRDESDNGLFEKTRSPPDVPLKDGATDPPGSFHARRKRAEVDGEKVGKYKDVRGFRLHAERGYTFWRFNIEVELSDKQQRIAYRINRGPSTGFWVPAKGTPMNVMFHSCNGFSLSVNSDDFSGPDPMWRDVLNTHQSQPFHVMIGGGDQIYNDCVMRQTKLFQEWLTIKNPLHKHNAPFTREMQDELEGFYLERYAMWFSQGLFGMANSQIPMVNMFDDHDIIDGFGSYPHHFMMSPVFSGLGNVAFKYYMLFQHQSVVDETEASEPSWTLGAQRGLYINELSRSLYVSLGGSVALLAVDARTERTREDVLSERSWKKIMDRAYDEVVKGKVQHLLVLLGVPIAYPRLVWLENILTSRVMDPIKALGKAGLLGNFLNKFDGGVEVLDDLDDHWTAKNHKKERSIVIEDLQDLAADESVRITILSGDVHLAAIGQFYSNPKLGLAKHKDFRYMPNIISSAIVNTPPPDIMADILNKRNKVHHFDKETDEDMIPIFNHGVDGKPRNNKRLLPHRNWCSIRPYVPGNTPAHSPASSPQDITPHGTPQRPGGILRRLSKTRREPSFRGPDAVVVDRSRPPISAGIFRSFSRTRRASEDNIHHATSSPTGPPLTRTLSLGDRVGNLFRRRPSQRRHHDDGGINGTWGDESDDDDDHDDYDEEITPPEPITRDQYHRPSGPAKISLRGGAAPGSDFSHEYMVGDDDYFTAKPAPGRPRAVVVSSPPVPQPSQQQQGSRGVAFAAAAEEGEEEEGFRPKPFLRTPTNLSQKQMKKAQQFEVDLEGGLEVCINVEVSQRDPAGITVPYRLLVPRLWYEEEEEEVVVGGEKGSRGARRDNDQGSEGTSDGEGESPGEAGGYRNEPAQGKEGRSGGIRRLFSLKRGKSVS
ncbi:hypothetical protein BR93DRAFT_969192 [Coniochaeta sp. PMI_546]|nr:hypothetical protein BR93DRAFT_969192 [Coniochaeta sp. PMI_546]